MSSETQGMPHFLVDPCEFPSSEMPGLSAQRTRKRARCSQRHHNSSSIELLNALPEWPVTAAARKPH
eukprot:12072894-Alexandrium_andersonii.AAC.1